MRRGPLRSGPKPLREAMPAFRRREAAEGTDRTRGPTPMGPDKPKAPSPRCSARCSPSKAISTSVRFRRLSIHQRAATFLERAKRFRRRDGDACLKKVSRIFRFVWPFYFSQIHIMYFAAVGADRSDTKQTIFSPH